MDTGFRPIKTGSDADLAFAVMVLASYFTTFSILQTATTIELLILIMLGVAYITNGIYGYATSVRSGKVTYHLIYFTIQLILGGFILYIGKGSGYNAMVLLPLAGHSVVLLARNLRIIVNLAIVLTYVIILNVLTGNWSQVWSSLPIFIAGQIFIVVFTQMAVSEERARAEVEKLVSELEAANKHLREYAMKVEELAITKERNRMAREIHDGLGHYLTTVFMQIQAARAVMKTNPQKATVSLLTAQNLTQEALVDVRRSVSALRDVPDTNKALQDEVEKIIKGCENVGISTDLRVIGTPRNLSPQAILTIYRSVQEGVNNTVKHANASRIGIMLDYSNLEVFHLVISDDGVGAENVDGGFGLLGMRERVNMLNGEVEIKTSPGSGFVLEIRIPE